MYNIYRYNVINKTKRNITLFKLSLHTNNMYLLNRTILLIIFTQFGQNSSSYLDKALVNSELKSSIILPVSKVIDLIISEIRYKTETTINLFIGSSSFLSYHQISDTINYVLKINNHSVAYRIIVRKFAIKQFTSTKYYANIIFVDGYKSFR